MFEFDVRAVAGELAAADPKGCDRDQLAGLVERSQQVRGWLDALEARIALRAGQLAEHGESEPATTLLAGIGRRSVRDAEAAAQRAQVCAAMPAFHDALAAGAVSAGHVDAVARAVNQLDDAGRSELTTLTEALVASASSQSVEVFERECRDLARILSRDDGVGWLERLKQQRRVRRWVDRQTGMCKTLVELDPENDAKISAALDAALAGERAKPQDIDVNWDHLAADVLVGLITGARSLGTRVAEISVLIDLDTLRSGLHDQSVCETSDGQPLPPTPCADWAATPRSSRSCWEPTARPSTSAATDDSPPGPSAGRCGRCTAPAPIPTARCGSEPAASTTPTGGTSTGERTSPTSSPCAPNTTTSSTKAAGPLPSNPTAPSPSTAPDGTLYDEGHTANRTPTTPPHQRERPPPRAPAA
jgi:Domain of unknown function (DUF222)